MCIKYGEKGKYWSNYLRRCIDNQSIKFHSSTKVLDANKQVELNRLNRAVEQCIAVKYDLDESECVLVDTVMYEPLVSINFKA